MLLLKLRRAIFVIALAPATLVATAPRPASAALVDLPPIDRIVNYQPKLPLRVLTADGVEIAQFGSERREYVPLARTPKRLQDAVLAVERTRAFANTAASTPRAWHAPPWPC